MADTLTFLIALAVWLGTGVAAGVIGASLTTVTLLLVPDAFSPVETAVATARSSRADDVDRAGAVVAFHLLGAVLGLLYVLAWPLFAAVRPFGVYPTFADAGLVGAVLYVVFGVVLLPRSSVEPGRRRVARTHWLLAAGVFVVSLSHGYRLLESLA